MHGVQLEEQTSYISQNRTSSCCFKLFKPIIEPKLILTYLPLDIDECETDTDNCDVNAHCNNTKGSFQCTCNTGYYGDGVLCGG